MSRPLALSIDRARDALLVIDLQPDFMPGGPLAVAEGDQLVAPIAALLPRFHTVIATQDWHPAEHISFAPRHNLAPFASIPLYGGEQTLWPVHCVQGTPGARLHPGFPTDSLTMLLRKGMAAEIDSYSAFRENLGPDGLRRTTGLGAFLRARGITRVFICGLARDFCVRWTAVDAATEGFAVVVWNDLCRAVYPEEAAATDAVFASAGVLHEHSAVRCPVPGVSLSALGVDVYQLTTLIVHAAEGRLDADPASAPGLGSGSGGAPLAMNFFFRRLPHFRNYVVTAGLRAIAEHCTELRLDADDLAMLDDHPVLGPALQTAAGQKVRRALASLDGFVGDIDALPEGTLSFAGPAYDVRGEPIVIAGLPLGAYTPLVQVRTDLCRAKLIETPWLSRLNYLSMVASKAARVVGAATEDGIPRSVLEFGQRRTHPQAAVDASYAAYLGGCDATSNLAATRRYGVPSVGTMDHFAVQAAEQLGIPVQATEARFFARFCAIFPHAATMLVDTYDTWQGLTTAVRATAGACTGIRLDSGVTPDAVRRAKALLAELGAPHVKVIASDGLNEQRVRELVQAGADGFGVGENITCSPDAATGIGAVGKLVLNGYGKLTMKLARGTGKATLPGLLQAYRFADHDLLALHDEPPPPGGRPLLVPLWRGKSPVGTLPTLAQSRAAVQKQIAALPAHLRALEVAAPARGAWQSGAGPWPIVISNQLHQTVLQLTAEASA